MKYTSVILGAFFSMAAAIPVGAMDHTLGNVNDAVIKRENLPTVGPMRKERLPIAGSNGDVSRIANVMELPIVTVDQSKVHRRDEHFKGDQKLPLLPIEEPNLRQPNGRYNRDNKLPIIPVEESNFHQHDEYNKEEDMCIEDSVPSRLSTLGESA